MYSQNAIFDTLIAIGLTKQNRPCRRQPAGFNLLPTSEDHLPQGGNLPDPHLEYYKLRFILSTKFFVFTYDHINIIWNDK